MDENSQATREAAPWVAIVANPFSGAGPNRRRVERLTEALRSVGLGARCFWDSAARRAALCGPAAARDCRCVVVAGGDGTVAAVVNERPSIPIAAIPLGNENLFARHFGFDGDPGRLARAIARGRTLNADLGRAGERLFILMAAAGFDAEVVRRLCDWREGPRGLKRVRRASYLRPLLGALRGYSFPRIVLEAEGELIAGAHAFVFNLPLYGPGLPFAPDARRDDGLLDWFVFEKPGRLSLAGYSWALLRGRHMRHPGVRHGRAARLRIASEQPVPVQLDGDRAGLLPVEISALPAALRVLDVRA